MLAIAYGYEVEEENDPFVHDAEVALKIMSQSSAPGWLVDIFPLREFEKLPLGGAV